VLGVTFDENVHKLAGAFHKLSGAFHQKMLEGAFKWCTQKLRGGFAINPKSVG